jgi:hypothetical protein
MWGFLDRLGIALSRWGNGKEREFGDEADSNYYMQFISGTGQTPVAEILLR